MGPESMLKESYPNVSRGVDGNYYVNMVYGPFNTYEAAQEFKESHEANNS